jgi:DNA repair exonuclease SbcCD ATPase subunit
MTLTLNSEAIRNTLQAWHSERDSFESQLNESLTALTAYQSHLDAWQQQLARERDELQSKRDQFEHDREGLQVASEKIELAREELRSMRDQFERDRSASDKSSAEELAAAQKELAEARDKVTALTTLLLNRTEELRTLDNRRAEVQTELELSRAREKELKVALDEHKRSVEQERSQYAEELHQLRNVLESQLDSPVVEEQPAAGEQKAAPVSQPPAAPAVRPQTPATGARVIPRENAVLGSIVEQFGKLRQQRASDRQANRPR